MLTIKLWRVFELEVSLSSFFFEVRHLCEVYLCGDGVVLSLFNRTWSTLPG